LEIHFPALWASEVPNLIGLIRGEACLQPPLIIGKFPNPPEI